MPDVPVAWQPIFQYSNSGYILLGYLIEKITHQPYRQFVEENLFVPLGMSNSGYDSNAQITGWASPSTAMERVTRSSGTGARLRGSAPI